MITKRHFWFNIAMIVLPWMTLLFIGKRSFKRYAIGGFFIIAFEIVNHMYGNRRNWWKFFDKKDAFYKDELPFSIGPYMPLSMWILKFTYGNFKKYIIVNAIADALFAFPGIEILKKYKIVGLHRLNNLQFFFYLHYKAYLLYALQYLVDKFMKMEKTA